MNRTKIEWVLNPDGTPGYTWNPITGCLNGCEYCYARKLANGRLKSKYQANMNLAPVYAEGGELYAKANNMIALDSFYPRFWPSRMFDVPMKCYEPNKHLGIFICDMSDLFGMGVPEEWTQRIMTRIRTLDWHRFYLLTKQPQNLIKFSPFLDNCWVGVTATNRVMFNKAAGNLAEIEAKVKYISFEPLLDSVDRDMAGASYLSMVFKEGWLNWVIIGAQTKPYKPPKWEWVKEIISACVDAGIPYFLKNNLEPIIPKVFGGEGNLRQELPA